MDLLISKISDLFQTLVVEINYWFKQVILQILMSIVVLAISVVSYVIV